MREFEVPKFQVVRGKEAINALSEYISELEQYDGEDLSRTQITALIKLAKGLISSIENETPSDTKVREPGLLAQVRGTVSKLVKYSSEGLGNTRVDEKTRDTSIATNPLIALQHPMK
ncbi:MAG: hypothetical protein NWF11_02065 [Candidatus Bathyarchaeota archaeon]|nr:hypothetical protein [Candidatus Bathyarchaeota archaeon]